MNHDASGPANDECLRLRSRAGSPDPTVRVSGFISTCFSGVAGTGHRRSKQASDRQNSPPVQSWRRSLVLEFFSACPRKKRRNDEQHLVPSGMGSCFAPAAQRRLQPSPRRTGPTAADNATAVTVVDAAFHGAQYLTGTRAAPSLHHRAARFSACRQCRSLDKVSVG